MPNLTSEPLESSYRVVVIGAGLAGVSAANELLASGHFDSSEVCILEAQSRIGGRVQTKSFSDELPVNVEVGAAWIHGTEGNPFAELAKQFGISFKEISPRNPWLHPGSCSNFLLFDGSRQLSEQQTTAAWEWQDLLMSKLQTLARSDLGDDHREKTLSAVVDHLLESDQELLEFMGGAKAHEKVDLFLRLMEAWFGLTTEDLNLDVFVETDLMGDDPGAHCIVPAGMERFIDHLAEPIRDVIHTNVSVATINYDGPDGVVIECTDGRRVTADRVIVATSLGLLQSGKLHFQPELPAFKAGALKRSKMGQYMKVLVQFPEVFWPKHATFMGQLQTKSSSGTASDGRRIYFPLVFNYHLAKGVPILEGVLIGDNASKISASFTDEEIAHALFLQMQETFGSDVPKPVNQFITRYACISLRPSFASVKAVVLTGLLLFFLPQLGPRPVVCRRLQLRDRAEFARRPGPLKTNGGRSRALRGRGGRSQVPGRPASRLLLGTRGRVRTCGPEPVRIPVGALSLGLATTYVV
jgi:monoamine oxidase